MLYKPPLGKGKNKRYELKAWNTRVSTRKTNETRQSHVFWRAKSPELTAACFIPGVIHDIITNANYGENCLMVRRARVDILAIPLTCVVVIQHFRIIVWVCNNLYLS